MNFRFTVKFIKVVLGVFVTISLFVTFTQDAFKGLVSANFLFSKTPEFPVYIFIVGAFVIGLLIGLFMAATDHWGMARHARKLLNSNEELESSVASLTREIKRFEEVAAAKESATAKESSPVIPLDTSTSGELTDDDIASIE